MKKILFGALFGVLLTMVVLSAGANTKGAPLLTYVYSNSMEPIIRVNDGFFVWPVNEYKLGDIIMFRPTMLDAPYITHRIIGIGDLGFITKGENSPFKDQENGEPEIGIDKIVGKVVSFHGQPVIIPGLGSIPQIANKYLGNRSKYISILFLILGIITLFLGAGKGTVKRKARGRLRLHHVYRFIVISALVFTTISIYLGSRVTQIAYLVSEYPGTLGDQVKVNQAGVLSMEVRNRGLVPVWSIITGISPIVVPESTRWIRMQSVEQVRLQVLPQSQVGKHLGYVQIYSYPAVLPKTWITILHNIHPAIAMIATGLIVAVLAQLSFQGIQRIPGMEGWIPIKTILDKVGRKRRPN